MRGLSFPCAGEVGIEVGAETGSLSLAVVARLGQA